MTDSPLVISRPAPAVERWTLDDPTTRNAISSQAMADAIEEAVRRANADQSIGAVIITGAGPVFSSGGNIKEMYEQAGMFGGPVGELERGYREGIQRIPRAMARCEVPTIAAVNGPAVGAGCDLPMMCDLRIASRTASFAESFVRLGLISGDGGAWFLPRVVGQARAREMALTGRAIDADTAERWGMVSRVVEPEDLEQAALDLAGEVAGHPRAALSMTKRLFAIAENGDLDSVLDAGAAMQAIAHMSAEHRTLVEAAVSRSSRSRRGQG